MLLMLVMILATVSSNMAEEHCSAHCVCKGTRIDCYGYIPEHLSPNITEVYFKELPGKTLVSGKLCNGSWGNNITRLGVLSTTNSVFQMTDNVFACFTQLDSLRISTYAMFGFTRLTFSGLLNVRELDLTDCKRIVTHDLIAALSDNTILPKLSKLILSQVGRGWGKIVMSQNFVNLLGVRNITHIDFSFSALLIQDVNLTSLCDTLYLVNMSHVRFDYDTVWSDQLCDSLRVLDITDVSFPRTENLQPNLTFKYLNVIVDKILAFSFYKDSVRTVKTLYANRVRGKDAHIYFMKAGFFVAFNNSLEEIHCSECGLNRLQLSLNLTHNNIKYFDLTHNDMEAISSTVISNATGLRQIDLSFNKLYNMDKFGESLTDLFMYNTALTSINLARNHLKYIPLKSFSNNIALEQLDVSNNELRQITFEIKHLANLTKLNMRGNLVSYLDEHSRYSLDALYLVKSTGDSTAMNSTHIQVDLQDNPFLCSCDALLFIKWFLYSHIFAKTRQMYHCQINNKTFPMNQKAIDAAQDDCDRPKRRMRRLLLCTFLTSFAVILALISVYVLVKKYKRRKLKKQMEDRVALLREDEAEFKFPVFLAFSSADTDFVLPRVLQPLQVYLQDMVHTDRDLVCFGDRHFKAGRTIFNEIIDCLENCGVVVAAMSRGFCESEYCNLELEQARLMRKPIILVMLENVDEAAMNKVVKEIFRNYTRVRFVLENGEYTLQPDWKNVCESILQLM